MTEDEKEAYEVFVRSLNVATELGELGKQFPVYSVILSGNTCSVARIESAESAAV